MRSRALEHTYARANWGLKFRPTDQHWVDTDINVNEPVASGETDIDVTPNASTAIPVGTVIRMDSEVMSVTATGTTITVVRQDAVTHSNGIDIYKLVQDCVLWLPGQDDPQSAVIRDRSGRGNDGAITGATWKRTGQGTWELLFDGTDDKVTISADASLLLGSGGFALEFWVYKTGLTDVEYLMGTSSATKDVYLSGTGGAIKIDLEGASTVTSNAGLLEINTPIHLVIVRSGDDCIIYKNGAVFQTVVNGFAGGDNTTDEDLILGFNS